MEADIDLHPVFKNSELLNNFDISILLSLAEQ